MTNFKMDRRTLLQGMGAAALFAPFAQLPYIRRAQAAGAAKKAVFVYIPDGCVPSLWHPSAAGSMPAMSAPLAKIKQHLVFVDGLNMYSGGATHEGGFEKMLTGVGPKSIDVAIGEKQTTPHKNLFLGVGATFQNGAGAMSYKGEKLPASFEDNPLSEFGRVFGNGLAPVSTPTEPGMPVASVDPALLTNRRKSILDNSIAEISALSKRLGATEKEKLDHHLASLRDLEMRLKGTMTTPDGSMMTPGAMMAGACDSSSFNKTQKFATAAMEGYPKSFHKEENFKTIGQLQMDLAVLALSCGKTNVAAIQWSHTVSPTKIMETGVGQGNHDASHYGTIESAGNFTKLKVWFVERFVELIEKMAATPDAGGGTLLDNSIVLLCSELGDSNLHDHARVPFVLAGKCGGELMPGRVLDFKGKAGGENEAHTKLLVSIANKMGVPMDSFGYSGKGKGPLTGL